MAGYERLGGYSPSLRPSLEPAELAPGDHLDLDQQDSNSQLLSASNAQQGRHYNNYRYTNVPEDFDSLLHSFFCIEQNLVGRH